MIKGFRVGDIVKYDGRYEAIIASLTLPEEVKKQLSEKYSMIDISEYICVIEIISKEFTDGWKLSHVLPCHYTGRYCLCRPGSTFLIKRAPFTSEFEEEAYELIDCCNEALNIISKEETDGQF